MEAILDFLCAAKQVFGDMLIIGIILFIDTI
jgi:hypothetical protein